MKFAASAAALGLLLTSCDTSRADTEPAVRAVEAVPVSLARVVSVPSDRPLRATGRVTHRRDLKLAFKTGGLVKELTVNEGDRVEAGQVVGQLDPREIDAGLAQANAALTKARRDLKRVTALAADDVLPPATRDDAATAAAVARAQVAGLAFNKGTTTLVASTAGVVVKRLAEPGEVVGPGMPVLVIGENPKDVVRLEVGIPATERLRVTIGTVADVLLAGDPTPHTATVVDLAPTLTPGTDRIAATLEIEGLSAALAPRGLVAVATFAPRASVRLPAVPVTTLVEGDGKQASVWTLDAKGHVRRLTVTVQTIRPDGLALIADGLDGVTEVVDAGSAWLDESTVVTVAVPTRRSAPEPAHANQ